MTGNGTQKPLDQNGYFATLELAEAFATTFGDRRTMIYAVTAEGRSAHIKNA